MGRRRHFIAGVLITLTSCQQQQTQQSSNSEELKAGNKISKQSKAAPAVKSEARDDVGLFRWSSGLQMGQFWAAVFNKKHDTLRLTAEDENGNPGSWVPDVELADGSKLPTKGGVLNVVVGDQSATLQYKVEGGQPVVELLGSDGSSSAARAVELIRKASGRPVCLEFPDVEYVSCFSTKGVHEALSG